MRLLITGASGFIGTNLISFYAQQVERMINLDIAAPLNPKQREFWKKTDVMDPEALAVAFAEFQPTHVFHMAARTDCVENVDLHAEYDVNITGTKNVLDAIKATPSVERAIITSSQYVCGPQCFPASDDEYGPHTVYGQSKVLTEKLTRAANLDCVWTLTRPENIWGPWHMRYRREAWNVIRKGFYLHPGGAPVRRCYGYVGNVVWQMDQILKAEPQAVHQQVFYLGDRAMDIYAWVNELSLQLRKKSVHKVPRPILRSIGLFGDVATRITKRKFPLTSSRFRSMTEEYLTPIEKTFSVFGEPPFSLQAGVHETVEWLEQYGWNV
jgi:nucleoside-diphosphate-sugar epimerase